MGGRSGSGYRKPLRKGRSRIHSSCACSPPERTQHGFTTTAAVVRSCSSVVGSSLAEAKTQRHSRPCLCSSARTQSDGADTNSIERKKSQKQSRLWLYSFVFHGSDNTHMTVNSGFHLIVTYSDIPLSNHRAGVLQKVLNKGDIVPVFVIDLRSVPLAEAVRGDVVESQIVADGLQMLLYGPG